MYVFSIDVDSAGNVFLGGGNSPKQNSTEIQKLNRDGKVLWVAAPILAYSLFPDPDPQTNPANAEHGIDAVKADGLGGVRAVGRVVFATL